MKDYFNSILLFIFAGFVVFTIGDICISFAEKIPVREKIVYVDPENTGFIHIDTEQQSGFLNSEAVMASFFLAAQSEEETMYIIVVERYGYSRSIQHEVSTFEEAVMVLEGLKGE